MYRKIEDFLNDWQYESQATLKVFANVTDNTLTTKENENIRTMSVLTWHMTTVIGEIFSQAGLQITKPASGSKPPATMKEIINTYNESASSVLREVKAKWTDGLLNDEEEVFGMKMTKGKLLSFLILQQTHHRGQLTILMRLAGLKVPGVYGPAKEEWALKNLPAME
jgi:uncharacterized damage-inducible protein DinB